VSQHAPAAAQMDGNARVAAHTFYRMTSSQKPESTAASSLCSEPRDRRDLPSALARYPTSWYTLCSPNLSSYSHAWALASPRPEATRHRTGKAALAPPVSAASLLLCIPANQPGQQASQSSGEQGESAAR
jgi:hypothetical protein